jgi:glutamine synthetase
MTKDTTREPRASGTSPATGNPGTSHLPAWTVERLLGKRPPSWTTDDLVALAKDQGVRMVSLMHMGGDGWLKTLDFIPRSESHLRDIIDGGERADGSSLFAGTAIRAAASDVVLRPRRATAFFDPFAPEPTLALLCAHVGRDGQPLPQSPDTILRRACARLEEAAGVQLHALGEVEYFLGKRAEANDTYGADDRGYHATAPFVFGERLRRQAMMLLGEIGVPVKYAHSEVGYVEASHVDGLIWEQHEIELSLRPLPDAAEGVVMTHWVLRRLAWRAGMQISFEPIVRKGHAGSGLHFHFSPVKNDEHLTTLDDDGTMSDEARWLIGGLARVGGALMAFGNRSSDSFTRLTQGKEAPKTVTWGRFNRHALIRLPIQATTADGRTVTPPTIEFRLPDGSANAYLLLTGVAQAMMAARAMPDLDALLERTKAPTDRTQRSSATPVPQSMAEIGRELAEHREILEAGEVFPEGMISALVEQLQGI